MKKNYISIFLMVIVFLVFFTLSGLANFIKVTTEVANINMMPNSESEIVGKALEGDIFKCLNDKDEWIEIEMFSSDSRYIHSSLVKVLTGGVSAPFSNDICPKLMERVEEAKKGSLTESDVKSQNVLFDRYVLDIFHEFELQPVLYLIAVNRCIEGSGSKIGQRPTVEPKKETNESTIKTEIKESVKDDSPWYPIVRWQGKSIKNTETFHIPINEWRISWKTEPGKYGDMNFQIYVYKPPSELPNVVANVIGYDVDSSIMRGAGDYYLTINSGQSYIIIVENKY